MLRETTKSKTQTSKNRNTMKTVYNLIIVDESGSMCLIEQQAFAGMNETIQTVQQLQKKYPDIEQRITLMTFETGKRRYHLDNVTAQQATILAPGQYRPGGGTPLYDAVGEGCSKINAVCGIDDEVVVTIITDGEENSSVEYNHAMVKNLIEKLKNQGWTFTFIGTDNLDVRGMAHGLGIDSHLSFSEDAAGTKKMFAKVRRCREANMDCIASDESEEARICRRANFFNLDEK